MSADYGSTVVYYGPEDVRIEPMTAVPEPGAGDVLVKVEACAICGTDVKSYFKGNHRLRPPVVIGHEFCGTVVDAGPEVRDYHRDQRVTMATTMGCGECVYCHMGKSNLCRSAEAIGFQYPGAMAPYLLIPAKAVVCKHLVDVNDLESDLASLSEPLSCVLNGLSRIPLGTEIKTMAVVGAGAIGLMHMIAGYIRGVEKICCVSRPGRKAEIAAGLPGVTVVSPEDFDGAYLDLSGGEGFDFVAVTAPDNAVQAISPKYARKGGFVSFFSSLPEPDHILAINSRIIHYNEIVIFGTSDSTPDHVRQAVDMLQAHKDLFSRVITHRLPLSGFHAAMKEIRGKNAAKVVLRPEGA